MSEVRRGNRLLAILYASICVTLLAAYSMEVMKGSRSFSYLILFFIILIIPAIFNAVVQIKEPETNKTKYILSAGYVIMYAFALATSDKIMVFTYILPLILVLILTHDRKLLIEVNVTVLLVNIVRIIYNLTVLDMASDAVYIVNVEIEIALLILFIVFSVLTSKVDVEINALKAG